MATLPNREVHGSVAGDWHINPVEECQTSVKRYAAAHVTAEGCSGARSVRIRDFRFLSDRGPDCAGFDLGPTDVEMLLGALGSGLIERFLDQASADGVNVRSITVDVTGQVTARSDVADYENKSLGGCTIDYTITVESSAAPSDVAHVHHAVERTCLLLNLLRPSGAVCGKTVQTSVTGQPEPARPS